jgi:Ni/Fe-hydrogenase subunit HybB-like protein
MSAAAATAKKPIMISDIADNLSDDPRRRPPLVNGDNDYASVTEKVCRIVEQRKVHPGWTVAFLASSSLALFFLVLIGYLFWQGIGIWGNNQPVGWGFDIVNFVFWVGIGHAGTLISAVLFLFRQHWRTAINRFAEAMTIFAVICAGIFPAIHVGRVWVVYWLFPIPNQTAMWPNFRSPLLWDVFAVSTYFTVSLLFWYVGMIPDLATLRDRASTRSRSIVYGLLALGWNGSSRHWHRYEAAYLILAALATPLVLSVHSVVSFDFATSQIPGWHATIFPPYFVAGAIFSGFAMVLTLLIPCRKWFHLEEIVTMRHLENMNKIILATSMMVGLAYMTEFYIALYSSNTFETFMVANRIGGPYWWAFWIMFACNVVIPQLFWFRGVRRSIVAMFVIALLVNVGMWFERFVIIVSSLNRDYLPSNWNFYWPTWVDYSMLAGSFGLFFSLFLLFVRFVPMVAMAELKVVMPSPRSKDVPEDCHV